MLDKKLRAVLQARFSVLSERFNFSTLDNRLEILSPSPRRMGLPRAYTWAV